MNIEITCQSTGSISTLEDLHIIQDDLKDLTEGNYQKLKKSMLAKGFFAPFFVWKKDKANNLLDGTQRKLTLLKMKEEGIKIPDEYPIVLVNAENYQDAKERILAISSQYGKMTELGLNHFIEDIDISVDDLKEMFSFDSINLGDFREIDIDSGDLGASDFNDAETKDDEKNQKLCPHCGMII